MYAKASAVGCFACRIYCRLLDLLVLLPSVRWAPSNMHLHVGIRGVELGDLANGAVKHFMQLI
jgi:hypothetical protein